jgi:multiple sugar transport system ATP-binding protein
MRPDGSSDGGLHVRGLAKAFGGTAVLRDVTMDVPAGAFVALLGASGCGKSTLLRIIAGLEAQDAGSVTIGGAPVDHLPPARRGVAMVFQSYALYPHMTVAQNIGMPLELRRLTLRERLPLLRTLSLRRRAVMRDVRKDVEEVARQLQIADLLDRKPAQLSGGQRQRAALGRAMVARPRVFLFDEPLSSLDAKLRVHMREELVDLHRRLGATFIYVTHDQAEAMTMAHRVALMDGGEVIQYAPPGELYAQPADIRVASFIGSPAINLLPAVATAGGLRAAGIHLPVATGLAPGTGLTLGLRPEALRPLAAGARGPFIPARLRRAEDLGPEWLLHADLADGARLTFRLGATEHAAARAEGALEEALALAVLPAGIHLFDADGRRLQPCHLLQAAAC